MSKKLFLAGAAALSLAMAPQAAQAVTISTTFEASGNLPGYTSTSSFLQDFSSTPVGAFNSPGLPNVSFGGITATQTESGNSRVYSSSVNGQATKPFDGTATNFGRFLSIGAGCNPGGNNCGITNNASYTLNFTSGTVEFFSFVFSSLDQANKVTLNLLSATNVPSQVILQGAQILSGNDGGSTSSFNGLNADGTLSGRTSFNFGGTQRLASIVFNNGNAEGRAFEIDQIAVAAPEPATWAMMLLGFGLVGSQLRRRSRKPARALATA